MARSENTEASGINASSPPNPSRLRGCESLPFDVTLQGTAYYMRSSGQYPSIELRIAPAEQIVIGRHSPESPSESFERSLSTWES